MGTGLKVAVNDAEAVQIFHRAHNLRIQLKLSAARIKYDPLSYAEGSEYMPAGSTRKRLLQ